MFFKQEPHPRNNKKWVLWHSPVIRHNVRSREILGNEKDLRNPALYRGHVSLRECFLYIVHLAYQDFSAKNTMVYSRWVGPGSAAPEEDYITEESSGESGDDEKEKGHAPTPKLVDLILKTLTLTLILKAHHPLSVIFKTLDIHRFNLSLRLNLLAVVKTLGIRRFNLRLSLNLRAAILPKMLNTEVSHGEIGCSMSVSVRQHGVIILQLAEEGTDVAIE
ncbi:hypothetical protein BDV33DRAFT_208520 [Aspergillus novoparasiticus]|uniref:Uncharacterized protein n=1 Tax=Aspergillus novoparasiticus TaxID=986946 RepID=A0A5N6ECV4_9EURO|nr:hypothetical protein BDV33DRAFT_208520 [Aspergillus novoparasiticus]